MKIKIKTIEQIYRNNPYFPKWYIKIKQYMVDPFTFCLDRSLPL